MMNKKKDLIKIFFLPALLFLALALFQKYYADWLCWWLGRKTSLLFSHEIDEVSLLMLHHMYMFLLVFVPTVCLQKIKHIDFGYHIPIKTYIMQCLLVVIIYSLSESFIEFLFQVRYTWTKESLQYFVFQFFFSGTGEEILYRVIPIVIFDWVFQGADKKKQDKNRRIDFSAMLSAILFAVAHIPSHINEALYSQIYSFGVVFLAGIIFGWIYRKTHSVWMSMLAHGLSNVLLFAFLLC